MADSVSSRRSNILATGISLLTVGILYVSTNRETSGADPADLISGGPMLLSMPAPFPGQPDAHDDAEDVRNKAKLTEDARKRPVLSGRMGMLMHVLMLEKAQAYVNSMDAYSVNFHKQERIDGELREKQTIRMEVCHQPFSVYMKWMEHKKGQQLLFVPERNEGLAYVRLGGIRGRFIPPVRIKPDGVEAMADSRHPITKAGVLATLTTVLDHHREDLAKRPNTKCEMWDNHKLNGQDCYCFVFHYKSKEVSELYRSSITYLDKKTLIPLRICNYTWALDAENKTPEELNALTLIEDYAFTDLKLKPLKQTADMFRTRKL